jgi:hypothetical protein
MARSESGSTARKLILEGFVIVASILAAFGLDTWRESMQEREEEQRVLAALTEEFQAVQAELEFREGLHRRIRASVGTTLDALTDALRNGSAAVTIRDSALAWAYIPPTTQLNLGTLNGLVASGRLGIIRNPELRAALASWGGLLAELVEEEVGARNFVWFEMDAVLRARMDVTPFRNMADSVFYETLSPEGMLRESQLPVDFEVAGVFASRFQIVDHAIDEFEPLYEEIRRILGLIEASQR